MFSHITQNWRGRPLGSLETVVQLIGNTRTTRGLTVQAAADTHSYPTGVRVKKQELENISIKPHDFHGEWNYTLSPSET